MYALVEILGKQYKAQEGATLKVDKIDLESGNELEFDTVVAIADGENSVFGTPYVEGAKVVATLGDVVKGEKIKVFKFHRRKGYRRTQGHRQKYSMITIKEIKA
ncbi:MAG: 50S ribosomal protein L21 [Sphaerochaetaceae bacterium]|jgi:large subunit ribosomal protein L21|nr:50S ribosomal protein L21 [Sphaerochaetaceae bacterium]MDD3942267.1 50S ribosomal protein L21 [Sphaerochaetaceae bacterium]MDX9938943.1 50S ribosomal protein L21 [Sphaerochaetaceae bacterium]